MKKRWYLHLMHQYDAAHRTSYVREMEMTAEGAVDPQYLLQFKEDWATYGIEEAILYVQNGSHGNAGELRRAWEKIKPLIS